MLKRVFSNSLIYGVGNQLPKVINFLMLPLLTPFLTPKDYGIFGVLVAYITAITAFKSLGTTVLLSNSFFKFKNRYKFVWEKVYGLLSIWSIFLSLIFATIVFWALPKSENKYLLPLMLAYSIPTAFFDTTILIGSKYFQFAEKPLSYSLITIFSAISGIGINYICIVFLKLGYIGWVASMVTVSFVSFLCYSYFLLIKERIYPKLNFTKKWLKAKMIISLPVIPHFYSSYLITSSDRVILDQYHIPINQIGLYNLAYTFGGYFAIIGQSLGLAIGPALYQLYVTENIKSENQVRKFTFLLQAAMLVSAFLVALWVKEIFQLMIRNKDLHEAYIFSIILIMSYTYFPLYYAVNTKLQYMEKTKYLWRITFAAGIINVILNLIFVPFYGIYATSLVTFVSLLFMGSAGFFVKEIKQDIKLNYHPFLWILGTVISLVLVFILKDISWHIKCYITLSIMFSILFIYIKRNTIIKKFSF